MNGDDDRCGRFVMYHCGRWFVSNAHQELWGSTVLSALLPLAKSLKVSLARLLRHIRVQHLYWVGITEQHTNLEMKRQHHRHEFQSCKSHDGNAVHRTIWLKMLRCMKRSFVSRVVSISCMSLALAESRRSNIWYLSIFRSGP